MRKMIYCCIAFTALFLVSCNDDLSTTDLEADNEVQSVSNSKHRSCQSSEYQASLLSDPDYRAAYDKRMEKARLTASSRSVDCDDPIVLPVAVHFQSLNSPDEACLRDLAQAQIDILNADYQALNNDVNLWSQVASNYPGVEPSNVCVAFCLADQGHPSGTGLSDGDPAVTFNTVSGDNSSTWSGYINIFVRPNLGFLGYSPLGGNGNGDGMTIDAQAFASGQGCGQVSPNAPFDLGRTLTHELGHYLSLDHLWGNGGCNSDDGISDTPSQNDSNFGCPSSNTSSCGSIDLHMSYMDYSDDACMYMFSNGQASNMNSYVLANFQEMIDNIGDVCSGSNDNGGGNGGGGTTDSDNDGIADDEDNCPNTPNPDQEDTDNDGVGDACDTTEPADGDGDGVADDEDNCPEIFNPGQTDTDNDGIGDACEESDPDPSDCDGYEVILSLTFDDYPEETSWKIKDRYTNQTVASGGDYEYELIGETVEEVVCLEDGCYKLIVKDAYGDGMCCDYGYGSFALLDEDGSELYVSDGIFGRRKRVNFCTDANLKVAKGFSAEQDKKLINLAPKPQRSKN